MLRPPSPLAAGLADHLTNQHPPWRISAQGPGAVDVFLDKLRAWKTQAPTRVLQRLATLLERQRQLDTQTAAWADVATSQQLERIEQLLADGADPNATMPDFERPLADALALSSPQGAMLLVAAGARITQEMLNTMSIQALLYMRDEDNGRMEILDAMEADGVDYSERWERASNAMPAFPWGPVIEKALETPGLDWYRPLAAGQMGSDVPGWIGRFAPITALESRQRLYRDLRQRLEARQAQRGERIGRPPLPDMTQQQLDRMIHEVVAGFMGGPAYLYGENRGEVLYPDERWERLGVLLARGADPNAGAATGGYSTAEQVFIHAVSDDHIKLAQTLLDHGATLGRRALAAMCEEFARHLEHAMLPLDQKYLGVMKNLDSARRKKMEEADKREFQALKRTFITKLSMGEQACAVSLDQIEHGRIRDRMEALVPGITREVDLQRLLAHTASAPNTQSRRGRRL